MKPLASTVRSSPDFPSHPPNLALICREVGAPAGRSYSFPTAALAVSA